MDQSLPPQANTAGGPLPSSSSPQTRQYSSSPGGKGVVLRALLGLAVLIVLILVIWKVVLPLVLPKSEEKVDLVYWGLWEDENTMKVITDDFHRENPNITVTYSRQDPKQYRERLNSRMGSGTGPDIYRYHNTWVPMLTAQLLPLSSDVISAKDLKNNYFPTVSSDLVRNGAILGLPMGMDTLELFVNSEIFRAAGLGVPKTWDDFVKAARMLTVKDEAGRIKTAGAALGTYDNVDHASDIASLLFVQNGVNPHRLLAGPDKAAEALSFYSAFAKQNDSVWDSSLDPSTLAFSKGNLAMYFGYSWDVLAIKQLNPNLSFEIHPVPMLPGRNSTIASYWVEGVSSKTKHPKEALAFMRYLAKKDTLQKLYAEEAKTRQFGEPYPRVDLAGSLKDNPLVYPFVASAPNAVSTPFSSSTQDSGLNAELNGYLGNTIRSLMGNTSVDTAVETLIKGQEQVLGRYGQ